jgi:hypothetical protein
MANQVKRRNQVGSEKAFVCIRFNRAADIVAESASALGTRVTRVNTGPAMYPVRKTELESIAGSGTSLRSSEAVLAAFL